MVGMKREAHFVKMAEKAASEAAEALRRIETLEKRFRAVVARYEASEVVHDPEHY